MKAAVAIIVACVVAIAWGHATLPGGALGDRPLPAAGDGTPVLPTNVSARVQCWAQTKSGNRCKRRAVSGERYCRQHSATIAPKKQPEKCRSFTEDGKPCEVKPVEGGIYCKGHLK